MTILSLSHIYVSNLLNEVMRLVTGLFEPSSWLELRMCGILLRLVADRWGQQPPDVASSSFRSNPNLASSPPLAAVKALTFGQSPY